MWVSGPLLHVAWLSIRVWSLHQGFPLLRTASFGSNGLHQEESVVQVRARSPRCPEPKAPETLALARCFVLPPQLGMEAEGSSGSPVSDTGNSRTPESSNGQVC